MNPGGDCKIQARSFPNNSFIKNSYLCGGVFIVVQINFYQTLVKENFLQEAITIPYFLFQIKWKSLYSEITTFHLNTPGIQQPNNTQEVKQHNLTIWATRFSLHSK